MACRRNRADLNATPMSLEQQLETYATDVAARRAEWHRYYSPKRLSHQYMQVSLLAPLNVTTVLEVGPYLGFVSSLLHNAGYRVTGLDLGPPLSRIDAVGHVRGDVLTTPVEAMRGHDAIVICETLEHFEWDDVGGILARLHQTDAKYLIFSVPYAGFQVDVGLYFNRYKAVQRFILKKLNGWKTFKRDPEPWGHKWEAGYRGFSLGALEARVRQSGWSIEKRDFTSPCRSVFYVLKR